MTRSLWESVMRSLAESLLIMGAPLVALMAISAAVPTPESTLPEEVQVRIRQADATGTVRVVTGGAHGPKRTFVKVTHLRSDGTPEWPTRSEWVEEIVGGGAGPK